MRRRSHFSFVQFRRNLSPFGQEVFDMLATRERTARNNGNPSNLLEPCRSRKNKHAQNRILTFGEEQTITRPTFLNDPLNNEDYFTNRADRAPVPSVEWQATSPGPAFLSVPPITTQIEQTDLALDVPTSAELVAATENHHRVERTSFPPANNQILDEIYGLSDEDVDECYIPLQTDTGTCDNNNNTPMTCHDEACRPQNVQWDDMFDDLLSHTDDTYVLVEDTEIGATDDLVRFPIKDSSEKTTDIFKKPKQITGTKRNKKITDTIPKKVKKIKNESLKPQVKSKDTGKNRFRKEKYTKTVSKWLDNVSPSNPIDDTDGNTNEDVHPQAAANAKAQKKETGHKEIRNKKVVQAQLANKDGIMKFKRPTSIDSTIEKPEPAVNADINKSIENTNNNKSTQSNVKQRKSQPKFVAPINSQIPVRDITYEVNVCNADNIAEHNLNSAIHKEIIGVLLYSNGFCQLNVHHAAAAEQSTAEGLMFCLDDIFYYFKGDDKRMGENILKILQNNTLVCYDGKSIFIYLMSCFNLDLDPTTLTTMDMKIAGSLVSPDSPPQNFSALQRLVSFEAQFTVATECPLQKAAWYCTLLADCSELLRNNLHEDQLWTVFIGIEMPIVPIIAEMEALGVCVDTGELARMQECVRGRLARVEAACYRAAGRRFQLHSAPQLRALLYDDLQLQHKTNVKVRETLATNAQSTSEAMLVQLAGAHRLPQLVLDYRRLHKAHATFLAGIAAHVKDGIIKPTWDQMAAATGRIGCSNPNLQAVPKTPLILPVVSDSDDGDQDESPPLQLRSPFSGGGGRLVLAADFRHVECRVLAAAARDTRLAAALLQPDLFRTLAAEWLQKPEPDVSECERERTKRIVYASVYGAGARRLMDILDVDYPQALAVGASFNRTFPSLKQFASEVLERMRGAGGVVRTLLGRARRLPAAGGAGGAGGGGDAAGGDRAHRQAVNFVVQGSAADLCKLAMAACARALRGAGGGGGGVGGGARLLLQLHDELLFSVPPSQLHQVAAAVREAMETCGRGAGLPTLPVRLAAGPSWGALQPYQPPTSPHPTH